MPDQPELALADLVFPIEGVSFSAVVTGDDPPEWNLDVRTAPRVISGQTWRPNAYLTRYRWNVRSWADMVASPIRIADGLGMSGGRLLPGVPLCALYVFEHQALTNAELEFVSRGGGLFDLTWTATADVNWNERYGRGVPLRITAPVLFAGFWTDAVTESVSRARVGKHFDATETVFLDDRRRGGGWLLTAVAASARRSEGERRPAFANREKLIAHCLDEDDDELLKSAIPEPVGELQDLIASAARRGAERCVRLLASRGAPLRAVRAGQTLLHVAASSGNAALVAYLVGQGLEIDARTPTGSTPLMMAAGAGKSETVAALLDAGADPTLVNASRYTALDVAKANGRAGTAALLVERSARRDPVR